MVMYKVFLILTLIPIALPPLLAQEQNYKYISAIEDLLFDNLNENVYRYSYYNPVSKDSIIINSHLINQPSSFKSDKLKSVCDSIRWGNRIDLYKDLEALMMKQDSVFSNGWGRLYKESELIEGLWEDQFESLCTLELTLMALRIRAEKWSAERVFKYLENLYALSYGDYDPRRVEQTFYKSDYVRNSASGYCQCDLLQAPNHDLSMIDELLLTTPGMAKVFVKELESQENVSDSQRKYYTIGTRGFLARIESCLIDSVMIENPNLFIRAGYQDAIDICPNYYPIRFYHVVLNRFRNVKETQLIEMLLGDVFKSTDSFLECASLLQLLKAQNDDLIDYIMENYSLDIICDARGDDREEIVSFLLKNGILSDNCITLSRMNRRLEKCGLEAADIINMYKER